MLAAAAALDETDGLATAIRQLQVRVARQRRQRAAVGREKFDFRKIHHRLGLHLAVAGAQPFHQRHQGRLDFAAQHGLNAQLAQPLLIHRRVQAIHAQMRLRRERLDARYRFHRDARGGVHGDIDRHQMGTAQHLGLQTLQREIETMHLATGALEPGGRFGQAERLAADFVGIDQDDFHASGCG